MKVISLQFAVFRNATKYGVKILHDGVPRSLYKSARVFVAQLNRAACNVRGSEEELIVPNFVGNL